MGVLLAMVWLGILESSAQTNDPIFRSWRWDEEVSSARAAGLAGTFVALADDGAAVALNPAGLALIPRAGEVSAGFYHRPTRSFPNGDVLASGTAGVSPAAFVQRLSARVGAAFYFIEPRAPTLVTLAGDTPESGTLDTTINGPGAALAVRVSPLVSVGANLNALRLYARGGYARPAQATGPALQVSVADKGETRITGSLGVVVQADVFRLGAAFRLGGDWGVLRRAENPDTGIVVDGGSTFRVHAPSVLSAGLAVRPHFRRSETLTLSAQIDHVRFSESHPAAGAGLGFQAGDYAVKSAAEYRVGVELARPVHLRYLTVIQLRAGYHRQSAGTIAYTGIDPGQRLGFPATGGRNLYSVGGSVGMNTIYRLHVAKLFGGESRALTFGIGLRYPGLFP